jgi:hypothetical protein
MSRGFAHVRKRPRGVGARVTRGHGRTGKARRLSDEERRAIERQLRKEGRL